MASSPQQPLLLLELPEHLLSCVLARLDPLSLNCAAQTCTALLRSASACGVLPALWPRQHPLQCAARSCLSAVLHLPPAALHACLDFSLSLRWPLYIAMEGLRRSLAARDVYELAERTALALQACIKRASSVDWLDSLDSIVLFASCRADRGYVRLALRLPAAAGVSLAALHGAGSLPPGPPNIRQLVDSLVERLRLQVNARQAGGVCNRPSLAGVALKTYRQLLADWEALLRALDPPWEAAALDAAAWAAWGRDRSVLHAATGPDLQLLVALQQAHVRGCCPGAPSECAVAFSDAGAAVAEHARGSAGSALGSLQLAPASTALARVGEALQQRSRAEEQGPWAAGQEGEALTSGLLPAGLGSIAQQHPREALLLLVELAALRVLHCCAEHLGGADAAPSAEH